jgi:predicted O-methyltransferase YrrM
MTERKLEKYIREHSSPENEVLEELYRQTHIRFVNPNMSSGYNQGKFLEMITRMINPDNVLEIGTYTGYSTICIARGLKENGKLITIEINDELKDFAHSYFLKASVENKITQLTGDALKIIPSLELNFDMVFIDGDKREYCEYFSLVKSKVKPGGFILADNVLWGDKVLETDSGDPQTRGIINFNDMLVHETDFENVIIPLRDGISVIWKIR